jgi:PAS domain S-box-containing protein
MNDANSPAALAAPKPIRADNAAENLYKSEEQYRVLFELCPIAAYSIDASGVIIKFNDLAAKLWGREPVIGDTDERFCGAHQLYSPDGSPMRHDETPMAKVVSGAIAMVIDERVVIERPDGSRVNVIVNIRPLTNSSGDVVGAINCFYEATQPIAVPGS